MSEVRKNRKETGDLKAAIDKALGDMPDDYVIKPFMIANKAEVENMCITEYNEEETYDMLRAECESRGEARGEAKGIIKTLMNLLKKGLISEANAAESAGMSLEDFRKAEAACCC